MDRKLKKTLVQGIGATLLLLGYVYGLLYLAVYLQGLV